MCHELSGVELDSSPSFLLHYPGPNSSTPLWKPRVSSGSGALRWVSLLHCGPMQTGV